MQNLSLFDLLPEEEAAKHRPIKSTDWKWTMANDYPKEKNGLKVFSCFACGGGSTMGYKLAGCEVIGCCEIDPKMNEIYVKNHNPKYNFLMDIRDFNNIPNDELPPELFNLDILDGSPPCTTFSMAGEREESWGKKKKFREGQAEQTLDDLSFVFIDTAAKLRPKVVIMENVEGLIKGEAWSYVQRIYKQLNDIGYTVGHWLLKGENMGVPQKRHRVFFVATRIDFDLDKIDMSFNYEPITYGEIKCGKGYEINKKEGDLYQTLLKTKQGDRTLFEVLKREQLDRCTYYQEQVLWNNSVCGTIRGDSGVYRGTEKTLISKEELFAIQTFPQDFVGNSESFWHLEYICGMSVPPIMIKRIVTRLIESGIFKENKNDRERND